VRRSWARQRARLFEAAPAAATASGTGAVSRSADHLVMGRDFKRTRRSRRSNLWTWTPALAGAVIAALFLVSLRSSILRVSYELADALKMETELLERQRTLSVEVGALRNPKVLQGRASNLDLGRPERVLDLTETIRTP